MFKKWNIHTIYIHKIDIVKPGKDKDKKFNELIELGCSMLGSTIGSIIGPAGLVIGPLAGYVFKKVGTQIADTYLSQLQKERIAKTLVNAIFKDKSNNDDRNKKIRGEEYFKSSSDDRSDAEKVFESILLKARDEYEEKKLIYYSNLMANLAYSNVPFEKANALIKIAGSCSYRQLCIIRYLCEHEELNVTNWENLFNDELYDTGDDLFLEIRQLVNFRIIVQTGIRFRLGKLKLSPLGRNLYDLMELSSIYSEDLDSLANQILHINQSLK